MAAGTVLHSSVQGIEFSRKNVRKRPLNSIHTFAEEFNLLLAQIRSAGQVHYWLQRIPHMMIHRGDHVKLFPNHLVPVLLIGEYHETRDQSADYIVEPFPSSMYPMAVQYTLGQGYVSEEHDRQIDTLNPQRFSPLTSKFSNYPAGGTMVSRLLCHYANKRLAVHFM